MNFKEDTIESNYIYKGKIINVRKDKVELYNGKTSYREIV
ncbi:MAG TPA: ADP-ribose pyrophosphatase, partial [Clostridiaceae bacterium]|nr:ADP-ribose pyrophosphatase [Clostridiaceae bacterium]